MQRSKCLKFRANVLDIDRINNEFIAVASQNQNIKIIAPRECKVIKNLYFDLLGKTTTAITFHPTQDIIAIANGETLYILDATHRNIMHTIQTHSGAITLLTFLAGTSYPDLRHDQRQSYTVQI